jgi:enoyl-CoA hydratase
MLQLIDERVNAWLADPSIRQLALVGAGERGLCAGGDIAESRDAIESGHVEKFYRFLAFEYHLDARLHESPKPYVTLMDGITFGGGIGLGAHASHRVVTERSRLAMPETRIGFLTDVGGSWRLAEMPGEVGMHVGLTAGHFGAGDAIAGGFADHFVPSAALPELLTRLETEPADAAIAAVAEAAPEAILLAQRDWIDRAYAWDSVPEVLAALDELAASGVEPAGEAAATIRDMSPTSLAVVHRLIREARAEPGLRPALAREYRVGMHLATRPDFAEGIRARIVDKDNQPRWEPARIEDVTAELIDELFETDATAPLFG